MEAVQIDSTKIVRRPLIGRKDNTLVGHGPFAKPAILFVKTNVWRVSGSFGILSKSRLILIFLM